ncbi:MAG: flippase [Clostridia bacterium]|nr:flippase [Clostridia bacterium]MBR5768145.1 flippase [Clostridia bacterium]
MNHVKKNLFLQTVYQVLSTCLPLITAPFLSRRLGATQLGVFSFTSSVVAYFTLAAMLGTVNYGTRSIAQVKDDREKRDTVFSGIFSLQIIVTLVATAAYVVYLLFFCRENKTVAMIQGVALISCLANINWLFFGVEEFRITVSRSIVIRIASVILILALVKDEADLWLYTLIMVGSTLLSNLILFLYMPKYVSLKMVPVSELKEHIKPNLVLFIPLLAMTVYHTMDKTMLGALSSYEQSGFYYNSDKVVQIPFTVVNGIGTVMLPRMSALLAEGRQKEADRMFMTTLEGVAAASIAVSCGIAAVANEFIPIFFGSGYDPCILITIVFTPILLVKGFAVIARTQYLIPMNMEKEFTKSVIGGAITNLILNLILIPPYGALGAAIATVIAELVACVMQFVALRGRKLGIGKLLLKTPFYAIIGFMMIGVVRLVSLINVPGIVKLIIEIVTGACFFGTVCLIYWAKTKNRFYEIFFGRILRKIRKTYDAGTERKDI